MNIRELWLDFRNGQIYFAFIFAIGTFMITSYTLVFETYLTEYKNLFFLFPIIYIPAVLLLGKMHRKHQYEIDFKQQFENNTINAKVSLIMIELIQNKAENKDVIWLENYLRGIANK